MTTKAAPKEAPQLESVKLIAAHTHKGEPKVKGDTIKVNARQKEWLIQQNKVAGPAEQQPVAAPVAAKGKE